VSYPLQNAVARNRVIRYASDLAVDRAMRSLHDMPSFTEAVVAKSGVPAEIVAAVMADRYHRRMKVDESNCRWCGLAANEALAEIGDEDE
jgi:hypothetical protein